MIESAKLGPRVRATRLTRRAAVVGTICFAVVLAISAHLRVSQHTYEYTGPLALLDHAFDLLLAGFLSCVSYCVGRRIARAFGLSFVSAAEEISLSIMLGVGAIGLAVLVLGLAGLLKPIPVGLLFSGFLLVAGNEVRSLADVLRRAASAATSTPERRLIAALFIGLVALLSVRAMLPPTAFDEAIYHLSVTKGFVSRGRIYPVYDNFSGNLPFLLHMVYAVCLIAKADIAAKLFSLMLAITSSVALFAFCARFLSRKVGVVAMFAFFGAGMVVEVAVTARIDVSLAGILFASFYAMAVYLESGEPGWLYASAALSGYALGIKYTAAGWFGLIILMFAVESVFRKRDPVLQVASRAILYVAISIAIASPWFIKNLIWFHNPVYPFITGELAETEPGRIRYFTAEDRRKIDSHFAEAVQAIPADVEARRLDLSEAASLREQRHPLRFWEYFLYSDKYNMSEFYHDPNYLFLLAPLFLLLGRKKWLVWLGIFSVAFYLFAVNTSWIARYLLPLYPPLTVLAAYGLNEVGIRLRSRARLAAIVPALAVSLAVGSAGVVCATHIYSVAGISFLRGAMSREQFMYSTFYFPPLNYINHTLPQNARVLMIGAQMGYDLQRDYIADGSWDATEWRRLLVHSDSLEKLDENLKEVGITHILVHPGMFRFAARMGREGSGPSGSQSISLPSVFGVRPASLDVQTSGPDYQSQLELWTAFDLFASKYLDRIFQDRRDDFMLYQVR